MAPELYLDVFILEDYEAQQSQPQIQSEETSREIQAELRSFF